MKPRLYLSGPISLGSRTENFSRACNTARGLMAHGFAVLNPMLSMADPDAFSVAHRDWIDNDLPWVQVADVVFRIPGESIGADEETRFAELQGIPVITRWHDLLAWKKTWEAAQPRGAANGT